MNSFDHQWRNLTALARSAPADPGAVAPYGFATRVAGLAAAQPASPWPVFGRFALRGLIAAAACCFAAVVYNYAGLSTEQADNYASSAADSIDELLDIS